MAVDSTPNASSVKVKFDHGADLNGDRIVKNKTFSSIKSKCYCCSQCNSRYATTYFKWHKQSG
ncbi:DUF1659 domain-containing protein [Clostridium sp.]|uniref:DUF1659 domain-containing protein n=1 Tax=Clostridium sp. TaxID=1506 RepID=UPI000CDF2D64